MCVYSIYGSAVDFGRFWGVGGFTKWAWCDQKAWSQNTVIKLMKMHEIVQENHVYKSVKVFSRLKELKTCLKGVRPGE